MCYSAQVHAEFKKFVRATGSGMDLESYVRVFWWEQGKDPLRKRPKVPRGVERDILAHGPPVLADLIRRWDTWEIDQLTREIFAQRRRVADAERALQAKATRKAAEDVRIGSNKVAASQRRLDSLKGQASDQDWRIYPGVYAPVIVAEGGQPVVRLMRYQCRPEGKPALYDRKFPGTYNARRDNLEGFWRGQFGRHHGLLVADVFFENVEGPNGKNRVLAFTPRTGEPMLIACLWSHWSDPQGGEPGLYSFAAITDDPEPEVAAAGHDRTVINIRPEHVEAWLNPDSGKLSDLQAILDDKRHPYYEHREAA